MKLTSRLFAVGLSLILSGTLAFADLGLAPMHPDPTVTPGDVCTTDDPDFVEYRYKQKIVYCVRDVSTETKIKIYDEYRIPAKDRHNYTIDHLIPLSIGGNNQDQNLWPEHKKIKQTRINLEQEIFDAVKEGDMTQEEAIKLILDAKMNPHL